jgi:putative transcriptional regulator
VQAKPEVIFDLPAEGRLTAAMSLLGIDFATLSDQAGHA